MIATKCKPALLLSRWLLPAILFCSPVVAQDTSSAAPSSRPNILWITSEDNGPQLGCYGDTYATTPNIDGLAAKGMRYEHCWSNAPVCAPARTTIITGVFPPCLGGQHMRSQVTLPPEVKLYPTYFRELGYYCTNNSKEDYNFHAPGQIWDDSSGQAHWRKRKAGQPFFSVFNFTISHESKLRTRPHTAIHDPAKVTVPAYHPDTPEVRQDWAQYYDRLTEMDAQVGQILQQLDDDGLSESTIVFYYGDHGSGMPRGKRWLYESGLRVPMIVHVPERFRALAGQNYRGEGAASQRLISFVDLVPTVLSLVDVRPPAYLQGEAFLGKYATPDPKYIFGFRDRMDERYDMARAVRDDRYLYIRNFYPQRPQGSYLAYMFQTPTTQVWKKLFDEGKLNEAQSFFWKPKPTEELYDIASDPYQVKNLAGEAQHAAALERLRGAARDWMVDIVDLGFLPEGQMLELAADEAPYTMGRDDQRYDVEQMYRVADLATRPTADDLSELRRDLTNGNSAVRFWVANGLLIRAMRGLQVSEAVKLASGMTTDPSPYVRCIANETVARFGSDSARAMTIDALVALADVRETNTFVAMTAMNSLDWCAPTSQEIGNRLDGIPNKDASLPSRYGSYVPNLVKRIQSIAE